MTLTLAIPMFGDEVAPRFCVADELLLADVVGGEVTSRRTISLAGLAWPQRLARLADQGVTVLLCGGFNRGFLPLAQRLGIDVIWGLAGRADQLMTAYGHGEIEQFRLCRGRLGRPGGRRMGRRRGRRGNTRKGRGHTGPG